LGRKIPLIFLPGYAKKKKKSAPLARKETGLERGTSSQEIVTIDGPAGAGKSTVSRMLARRLGYVYLDTGAMYRAVALLVRRKRISAEDDRALEGLCRDIEVTFREEKDGQRLVCQGEDLTEAIRDPEIGRLASAVSMRRPVREAMAALQRKAGSAGRIVAEGRDTGTVIFPRARYKFFLSADPGERALRRYRELKAKGLGLELGEVEREVRERDAQDSSRELAPLRPAEDARLVDSTGLTPEEVVDRMLTAMKQS
jgi:CMP/dCMP kinase